MLPEAGASGLGARSQLDRPAPASRYFFLVCVFQELVAEDAGKDGVHVAELSAEVEGGLDFCA
jgi:hypothetical protein